MGEIDVDVVMVVPVIVPPMPVIAAFARVGIAAAAPIPVMPTGIILLVAVIMGVVTAIAVMIAVTIPVVGSVAIMIPITVVATIPVMSTVAIMTSIAVMTSVAIVPVCMIAVAIPVTVAITSIASITTIAIAGTALITISVTISPVCRIGPLRPRIYGAGTVCICPLDPFGPCRGAFVTVVPARIALITVATVAVRPCIASPATPAIIPRFRSARGLRLGLIGVAVSAFAPLRPSFRASFFAFALAGLAAFFPRGDLDQIGVRAAVNNWS